MKLKEPMSRETSLFFLALFELIAMWGNGYRASAWREVIELAVCHFTDHAPNYTLTHFEDVGDEFRQLLEENVGQ